MIVCLTGVTGNMGHAALEEVLKLDIVSRVRVLILENDPQYKRIKKTINKNKNKIDIYRGSLANEEVVSRFILGSDYVFNMAAVIPPKSDKSPQKAIECNEVGVKVLVHAIEALDKQPKLVHISTVALYGNRTEQHPYGIVGDPILVSPFDIYSVTKMRGELSVLESNIKCFAVIRQSAMLHKYMLTDNISDGLLFHTCFNSPLEWVTSNDSGRLIANIIVEDQRKDLSKTFWHQVFNLGAPKENRITGYQTFDDGFKLIGGSTKSFFKPNFNATRNFHGMWFYDGYKLEELFHYQKDTVKDYWDSIAKTHKYYALAKPLPASLISKLVIQRLFKDNNSTRYWYTHKDIPRVTATFGSMEDYENVPSTWDNFPLLCEGKLKDGSSIDFEEFRDINKASLIDYGYDIKKKNDEITKEDILNIVKLHGGKMIGDYQGLYTPIMFSNQDNEEFKLKPYSILCGHWLNITYKEYKWDFDRLAKKDKLYASIWYESHRENENKIYYLDDNFQSHMDEF